MFGYIYKTTNLINNKIYIGKRQGEFTEQYKGSGKILRRAINKYGVENFKTEIICKCDSIEELNDSEIKFIKEYKDKFKDMCYNIAAGGNGGNVYLYNEDEKKKFINKMTMINRQRCSTKEFKLKASENMRQRYKNKDEREKQSIRIKEAWKNEELRKKQKEVVKNSWKKRSGQPKLKIPYILELHNEKTRFESRAELDKYLKEKFDYAPDRRTLSKMINENTPLKTNRKRLQHIVGMKIYRCNKDVETKADECKPVGLDISTSSKCEATN